ncbi:MAG: YeeE/YedE thiosulfate transporter family protein, partial [Burkholderiaceae bacterium]
MNEAANALVLGAAALVSVALGVLMNRYHFCTMGALSDWFNMSDFGRLRQWLAALLSAILLTQIMWAHQHIHIEASFYLTPKLTWLSHLVGGILFGFGMVLASGCGSKALIRLGSGSLKALVVVIVMGLAAYITMRGLLAIPRVSLI